MKRKKTDIKKRTLYQKIVNVFISIFIVILLFVFLFFGISQTSTFREYLRQTVVKKVNSSINGHLSIDKISGTLFTSLFLRNVIISSKKDTLLKAETIELKTSPLQLLFKKILIRKIELKNSKIDFITYKNGKTNLDNVLKSMETTNNKKAKPFPFVITVSNILLNNVKFYLHDNLDNNPKAIYDTLNSNNLNIRNINASLETKIDLNKNNYDLLINSFSCTPNINSINIKNIKSHITLNNNKMIINSFKMETSNSNFVLNGTMKKNRLLKALENNTFGNAKIKLNLKSEKLDLNEIGKFIPSILPIDGIINVNLVSQGRFNNLKINLLKVSVGESHIHINGKVKNLDNIDSLKIQANINKSVLYAGEISKKLKFLHLPEFKEVNEIKIDTLSFNAKAFGFNSNFKIINNEGQISGKIQMNFLNGETNYFGEINTVNISLFPIINIPVILNSKITAFGSGTDLLSMNSTVKVNANNSTYNNKKFDVLSLLSKVKNGNVKYQINAVTDSTNINSNGNIYLTQNDNLNIDLKTNLENFNVFDFTNDSSLVTNINLKMNGKGIKEKSGRYNLLGKLILRNSYINKTPLRSNKFKINLIANKNYISKLKINSSQLDAQLNGRFTIKNMINLISNEINSLTNVINKETDKFVFTEDTLLTLPQKNKIINYKVINPISNDNLRFSVKFKKFNLQAPFIGEDNINISGLLNGRITNKKDSINLLINSKLDYVKIWGKAGVYFLSDLSLNINLLNNFRLTYLSNLSANINLDTKRIFTGSDIKNIKLNYILKDGIGSLYFNSNIENKLKVELSGKTFFNNLTSILILNKLSLKFKKYLVRNEGNIDISYSKGEVQFKQFQLSHGKGKIKILGLLNKNGNHQLQLSVNKINLEDITNNILNEEQFKNIKGELKLNAKLLGNYLSPQIGVALNIKNVSIDNNKVGSLKSNINYFNKLLNLNLSITDSLNTLTKPIFSITGNLPIDLRLNNINKGLIAKAEANVKLRANNFKLITISNFIPEFTNLNGIVFADLSFKGKLKNLLPTGKVNVNNISFISDYNNMKYNAGLNFSAENGNIKLDSMYLSNVIGTKDGGLLYGIGNTKIKNYKLTSPKVYLTGQLKILNESSKSVSPLVYGDLVVATQGQAEFTLTSQKEYLKAPLLVKKADLTFPQAKPSFENTRNNYIYKYIVDTTNIDKDISSFNNLIKLSMHNDSSKNKIKETASNIVYDIDVTVEDEARIHFVLDKEFNQILNANISGNFQYKTIEGTPRAFGTLTLREGSSLDFLTKTFEAGGTLRFENELTNPYLNVVGIYRNYYYEPTSDSTNTSSQEKEVAVKVKLKGPLQDLNKNFVKTKNNLAVYYGTENIDKDIPDLTKDASDAIMFILTGHFSTTEEGFTTQQSNALTGTASSIAGSMIGGLLNSYAGDYIRSVEVKQVGSYTKFSLSGKVNKFKYTIGGTTEVFQDLSRTNVRIEYPLFQRFFIRVERKESLTESNLVREMINELALKYKFEF